MNPDRDWAFLLDDFKLNTEGHIYLVGPFRHPVTLGTPAQPDLMRLYRFGFSQSVDSRLSQHDKYLLLGSAGVVCVCAGSPDLESFLFRLLDRFRFSRDTSFFQTYEDEGHNGVLLFERLMRSQLHLLAWLYGPVASQFGMEEFSRDRMDRAALRLKRYSPGKGTPEAWREHIDSAVSYVEMYLLREMCAMLVQRMKLRMNVETDADLMSHLTTRWMDL